MSTPERGRSRSPVAPATLVGENGDTNSWLAAAFTEADVREEWDYLFENGEALHTVWFRFRWTTPEERADEDLLYDLFGDWEMTGVDISAAVERAAPESDGAHRYWTTEP